MKRIILITGGQRSGKSSKAEELALSLSQNALFSPSRMLTVGLKVKFKD
jgi:adenosyl cobinamide kinase/adenosyl cobinamide phosphate guanylyltransferase